MFFYKNLWYILLWICLAQSLELTPAESPVLHPQCWEHQDLEYPKFLPYPQDCSKYYSCLNGLAYVEKCPEPFLWNPINHICDNPQNVQCQPPIQPQPAATAPPPVDMTPRTTYEIYPNDCNRYYQCEARACPQNYHWNAQQQKCDFPHLAQCPFMLRPTPALRPTPFVSATEHPLIPATAPTAAPAIAIIPHNPTIIGNAIEPCDEECQSWCMGQGHIYLPYPSDCRKFIQCNGLAFVHKCPDQLLWNDKLKTCDRFCVRNNVS